MNLVWSGTHGWPETGFLREYLVTGEEMGKNPVSSIVRECPETGFLLVYTSCEMRLFKRSYSSSNSHILAAS
ncbi:hypothetical protein [Tychonema sp. BBK16]|uniref:hypothetical protein n=1 Tax=Tychonema sp. BBK16 TaxID=2699888 RepID=UPI001F249611|nr:hypothetical protein [Tychonema sp. BBK16]MCF6375892.1 hypothetical protein [Tychonema sp. BBK16]